MKSEAQRSASTIEVDDLLEVITQNSFSNQKQVELLQILNFTLPLLRNCKSPKVPQTSGSQNL